MSIRARVFFGGAVALFLSLSAAGPSFAVCNPDGALFDDNFEFMDASWGEPDDKFNVKDGALVVKSGRLQVNFLTQNEGANVCADLTIADAPEPDKTAAGLIFWWKDWNNYYYVYYWTDGNITARRVLKGKTDTIFTTQTAAIKKGIGQTNNIELRINPKDTTLLINGTEVKRFKGVQPKGGGMVGITAGSPDANPATFTFDNFVVSALAE